MTSHQTSATASSGAGASSIGSTTPTGPIANPSYRTDPSSLYAGAQSTGHTLDQSIGHLRDALRLNAQDKTIPTVTRLQSSLHDTLATFTAFQSQATTAVPTDQSSAVSELNTEGYESAYSGLRSALLCDESAKWSEQDPSRLQSLMENIKALKPYVDERLLRCKADPEGMSTAMTAKTRRSIPRRRVLDQSHLSRTEIKRAERGRLGFAFTNNNLQQESSQGKYKVPQVEQGLDQYSSPTSTLRVAQLRSRVK